MRRLSLLLLPLLVLACSKEQAGTSLVINYTPGFQKGCFRVVVQDAANDTLKDDKTVSPNAAREGEGGGSFVKVGVLQKTGWSKEVNVTVTAHEYSCETDDSGTPIRKLVGTKSVKLTLPDEGAHGESEVSFETPDEDHDGFLPADKGGTDCDDKDGMRNPAQAEICDDKDNNCAGTVADEDLDLVDMFHDRDEDGFGGEATRHCVPVSSLRKYSTKGGDCNDSDPSVAPDKEELCDGIDNNCASIGGVAVDETFSTKNQSCASGCGTMACALDGRSVQCSAPLPAIYYLDKDRDGEGTATVIQTVNPMVVCQGGNPPAQPDYVLEKQGDCDDADPAAKPGLTEVCDAIDNNCDGIVDNAAEICGGTLKDVVNHHVTSGDPDWRTVSVGPGGYPVWVAGLGGKLAMRRTASDKFESFSYESSPGPTPSDGSLPIHLNNCGSTNWTVSWVNSKGMVFLGGELGALAFHSGTTSYTCQLGGVPHNANLTGMIGFESGGVNTLYITDTEGRLIKWVVGGTPAFTTVHDSNYNYYGLHGLSENFLLVSGGVTSGDAGQAFQSYTNGNGNPSSLHATLPDNGSGTANAVWMGTATKACAVGDGGLAWRWDEPATWRKAEASGTAVDFSSVVMRYDAQNPLNDQCYIVDKGSNGKLRRLTPYGWAKPLDLLPSNRANVPLRDIAITATGDLWIVGDDGRVFHYPEQ
ncbi:MopE-related protein [Corallococcus terminator]